MSKNRNIFEEVQTEKPLDVRPTGGLIDAGRNDWRGQVAVWMLMLFALVVMMIVIGGLTRLTDSGLSITEWNLIKGAIPPLNEADWNVAFEKYRVSPEYLLQNKGMAIADFKTIFWWEWGHRQLGRLVGAVWALGFLYFMITKTIPRGWKARMLIVGVLGGLQGAIGWWMVSSGLTGRVVDVASYRLATHLGLAFIIMATLIWNVFMLGRPEMQLFQARRSSDARMARLSNVVLVAVFAQILLGALVAGIDAGRGYIDWPMMNGQFLPSESFDYEPFWTNFFENPALVQFNHRMLGYFVMGLIIFAWLQSRKSAHNAVKSAYTLVLGMTVLQMLMGIFTVLYAAPWHIAILHQLGAVILVVLVLRARFAAIFPIEQSLRS